MASNGRFVEDRGWRTLMSMDSLADLLAKRRPQEPPEIRAIKNYVMAQFKETVGVTVRERDILITVRSSALAGALRIHAPRILSSLDAAVSTESQAPRRLVFRVGSLTSS